MERKEHIHRNQNETLLRPGSASLAIRLRMSESEERGRAKVVSGRDELAEENHICRSRNEKVRNEQTREELGAQETVVYTKDPEKDTVVWTRGTDGGEKTTKCSFTWACRGKEKCFSKTNTWVYLKEKNIDLTRIVKQLETERSGEEKRRSGDEGELSSVNSLDVIWIYHV